MNINVLVGKRYLLRLSVRILLIFSTIMPLHAQWTGSGTSAAPYQIKTAQDLKNLSDSVNNYVNGETSGANPYTGVYFKVMNDIDLTGYSNWESIGRWGINVFRGSFDGGNYKIKNLKLSGGVAGLFGQVGAGAEIKNVILENVTVTNGEYMIGPIVANVQGQIVFENCTVRNVTIQNTNYTAGGMIGEIAGNMYIKNILAENVSINNTKGTVGAIVGYVNNGDLTLENAICNLNTTNSIQAMEGNTGGLVGRISGNATFTGVVCNNQGTITGNTKDNVGGLVGSVEGNLNVESSSYNAAGGKIKGNNNVGGIAGNVSGTLSLKSSSSIGTNNDTISGAGATGGLIGRAGAGATCEDASYEGISITGDNHIGGIIGSVVAGLATVNGASFKNGNLNGTNHVGGIIGSVYEGNASLNEIDLIGGNITGNYQVAGVVAWMYGDTVKLEKITHTGLLIEGQEQIGGFVGRVDGSNGKSGYLSINNINISSATCEIIGYTLAGGMAGKVDGDAVITNITAQYTNFNLTGTGGSSFGYLLGRVDGSATIQIVNLTIDGGLIKGYNSVGGLAGEVLTNAMIDGATFNCAVNIEGNANDIGGFIGTVGQDLVIKNSNFNRTGGVITGGAYIGGMVGRVSNTGIAVNLSSNARVNGTGSGVGGIFGLIRYSSTFENLNYTGDSLYAGGANIGGLAGQLGTEGTSTEDPSINSIMNNCNVSTSFIQGPGNLGGLVGILGGNILIDNCHSQATIATILRDTNYVAGGVIGVTYSSAKINNVSHTVGNITGRNLMGGIIGEVQGDSTFITNSYKRDGFIQSASKGYISSIGGIVGRIKNIAFIDSCTCTAPIQTAGEKVGGICGVVDGKTEIKNSDFTGNTIVGTANIGGIVGEVGNELYIENSHSLSNIELVDPDTPTITLDIIKAGGICGSVDSITVIKNSTHEGTILPSATSKQGACDYLGGIAGYISNALTIDNVSHNGNITGRNYIGGAVGRISNNLTVDSLNIGTTDVKAIITGNTYVGGLAGYVDGASEIENTNVFANINLSDNFGGGLVGYVDKDTKIRKSNHEGTVLGQASSNQVGGIAGTIAADLLLENVKHTGNILGASNVGGFGGEVIGGASVVSGSFCQADVLGTGTNTGGLFGNIGGTLRVVQLSHYEGTVTGNDNVGGLIGITGANSNVFISNITQDVDKVRGGNSVGGLIGVTQGITTVDSVSSRGNLIATGNSVGGFIGNVKYDLTIRNSMFMGDTVRGIDNIGGLLGQITSGETDIDSCVSLIRRLEGNENIGGICGTTAGGSELRLSYSYKDGISLAGKDSIIGTKTVGGLIGSASGDETIFACFNRSHIRGTGDATNGITGDNVGGFVGYANNFKASHSYNTGSVHGDYNIGGLYGNIVGILDLQNNFNIGRLSGISYSAIGGNINNNAGTVIALNYVSHCIEKGNGYNGIPLRADSMCTRAFAETLGTPFIYTSSFSLPKLPQTNHLFVSVVSDPEDPDVIDCVYDFSYGDEYQHDFNPISRLLDNAVKITELGPTYTLTNLQEDHLIVPMPTSSATATNTSCDSPDGTLIVEYTKTLEQIENNVTFYYAYVPAGSTPPQTFTNVLGDSPYTISGITHGTYDLYLKDTYNIYVIEDIEVGRNEFTVEVDMNKIVYCAGGNGSFTVENCDTNKVAKWYVTENSENAVYSGNDFNPAAGNIKHPDYANGEKFINNDSTTNGPLTFWAECENYIGCRTSVTFEILENPKVNINPAATICAGESSTITITLTSGNSDSWSVGLQYSEDDGDNYNDFTGSIADDANDKTKKTVVVVPTQRTIYQVKNLTDGNGCKNY